MSKSFRCAVVGTGVVGTTHVKVLPMLPQAQLVAVCDKSQAFAEASLKKAEIDKPVAIYTSLDEMLRRERLDVLHVATPSGDHLAPALAAINAGVNVILEKPLEIALDRADQIIAAARNKNVRVACIFQNRYKPENRAIRDAAQAGRFGTITWAGSFTPWYRTDKYYSDGGGWRGTWKFDGGGAIMNQSIHSIDLLQWIAGRVRRVSAYAANRIHPAIEVEDTLSCSLEFENGALGTIVGTTALYPGQPARIEIGGENGTAISENGLKLFKFRDERPDDAAPLGAAGGGGASASNPSANPAAIGAEMHRRNIADILTAWSAGGDAETSGIESRKSLAIVLAMYESARRGGDAVDVSS